MVKKYVRSAVDFNKKTDSDPEIISKLIKDLNPVISDIDNSDFLTFESIRKCGDDPEEFEFVLDYLADFQAALRKLI